jgi:hypothetical protein
MRARSSPCPAKSVATRAYQVKPCSWTSQSFGSGRVQTCSSTPSNRMDSRCESFADSALQRRRPLPTTMQVKSTVAQPGMP